MMLYGCYMGICRLRDDERTSSVVISHITAENTYTKSVLADTETLQQTLYTEMRARIQEADRSAPQQSHGYWYYTRTEEGAQYPVHCRRAVAGGASAGPPLGELVFFSQINPVLLFKKRETAKTPK